MRYFALCRSGPEDAEEDRDNYIVSWSKGSRTLKGFLAHIALLKPIPGDSLEILHNTQLSLHAVAKELVPSAEATLAKNIATKDEQIEDLKTTIKQMERGSSIDSQLFQNMSNKV